MGDEMWLQRAIEVLYGITRAVNAEPDQQKALEEMLGRICRELGYKAAALRLLDEEHQQLQLKAAHGFSRSYLDKGIISVVRSGVDQAVLAGQRITLPDVRQDERFQYSEAAAREGLVSMLAVPVAVQDRIIGVLHVYTDKPHQFDPREEVFVAAVANLGAQAIRRTQCFEAIRRIASNINSSLEIHEVLTSLLLQSVKELNVKAGSIRLLGPDRLILHLAAAYGLSEAYLKKGAVQVDQSPIDQRVLKAGRPVTISDVSTDSGFQYPEEARREGIRSVLVLPLRLKGTMIGVMRLYSSQVRSFGPEESPFALALADLGAVAIENARLHEALKRRLEALKEDVNGWYRFLTFG